MKFPISVVILLGTIYLSHYCSSAAVLKSPEKEFTFSTLLSKMHEARENARMDTATTSRLWDSTGRILKALLKMASSRALKRRSGRFFQEESKAEESGPNFRSSRSSASETRQRGRGRIVFPTEEEEIKEITIIPQSPQSRSPKWPSSSGSHKKNKVALITKVSPPKYYAGNSGSVSGVEKMNNYLQFKNSPNPFENTGILEQTSMIRSQPLIVELGPGTTRDGRRLKTVEVQGVKIIVGEPKEDDPYEHLFSWNQ